ncbi:MAG: peptide ABC transporter substrate-binding protein [Oscillochloridaceae bacterium umkhey_bin13]
MSALLFRRRLTMLVATLALIGLITGCSFAATPPPPTTPAPPTNTPAPPTPTPLPRGGDLTVALAIDLPTLRPWQPRSRGEEQLTAMLYSGLVRLDAQLRPTPDLAESWEATADGRTLTVTLRTGLTWHDGAPLEAADVLFTLERLRALPLTSTALLADLRYISGATAPDATTVVITLTSRFAPILPTLAVPILPRHLLEGRDLATVNLWEVPVGSGPFQLGTIQPGQQYILDRFEGFHRGAPLLDRVIFQVSPDPVATRTALADGSLLLAELPWGTHDPPPAGTRLATYPENGLFFLGFNLRSGRPFNDLRLRQALALALDLPRVVEGATKGQGRLIGSTALPGSWADLTSVNAPPPDLDAARALLDEAGWTLPAGATIRQREDQPLAAQLFVRADDERRVLAARQIAAAGATIGMQISVEAVPFEVVLARYAPPFDFDLLLGSWRNGAGDPDFADVAFYDPDDFALFHSSQLSQGDSDERATRNFVGYASPVYDAAAQAARQLYNLDERRTAIDQAQAAIKADLPYLFLWVDQLPVVLTERMTTLDGPVELDGPLYYWNIERWYLR